MGFRDYGGGREKRGEGVGGVEPSLIDLEYYTFLSFFFLFCFPPR